MTAAQLLSELERTRDETLSYFDVPNDVLERRYAPGKWSVRYLLHHLSDSESVMSYRLRRVISEPRQVIWFYDQDAWAAALDYSVVPLDLARKMYEASRASTIYYAERFYEERGGTRFVHSVSGLRTLKDEFDKVADHNEHHLAQIRAAINGGTS